MGRVCVGWTKPAYLRSPVCLRALCACVCNRRTPAGGIQVIPCSLAFITMCVFTDALTVTVSNAALAGAYVCLCVGGVSLSILLLGTRVRHTVRVLPVRCPVRCLVVWVGVGVGGAGAATAVGTLRCEGDRRRGRRGGW